MPMFKLNSYIIATVGKLLLIPALCLLASCSSSDVESPDGGGGNLGGENVDLSFTMQLPPASTRSATVLPAEVITTLRLVVVDLGLSSDDETVIAPPSVEYNKLYSSVTLREESDYEEGASSVTLSIPQISAGRKKKIYLLVNAEPSRQSYLDIRLEDGSPVARLDDESFFLPDAQGNSPIDNAVFSAPVGSYLINDITSDEEFLAPMTAMHFLSVPTIDVIAQKYPTINNKLTYPLPDLMVVRAVNKIWFDFVNATFQPSMDFKPLDLLVTAWELSDVNLSPSFMFGKVGDNGNLFKGYTYNPYSSVNEPWMQWLMDEGRRSQSSTSAYAAQWLTEYSLPEGTVAKPLRFTPGNFSGQGEPSDNDGLLIAAPVSAAGRKVSTEMLPVYFPESHAGNPQCYKLSFTVWQRAQGEKQWQNPFVYSITSALPSAAAASDFVLLSLFRNTDVVMEAKFVYGKSGVEMIVEVLPYGSVILNPGFGL